MDQEFSQITVPSGTYKVKDTLGRKNLQDYEKTNDQAVTQVTQTANQNKTDIASLKTQVGNINYWNISYTSDTETISFTQADAQSLALKEMMFGKVE